ncbi:hypothetical protein FACS1894113_4320 [Alphaproteobacteria bacterium]|nr:hypothetical protein FACS1894113_4320 [Alphaproteobacteria bacterium]
MKSNGVLFARINEIMKKTINSGNVFSANGQVFCISIISIRFSDFVEIAMQIMDKMNGRWDEISWR